MPFSPESEPAKTQFDLDFPMYVTSPEDPSLITCGNCLGNFIIIKDDSDIPEEERSTPEHEWAIVASCGNCGDTCEIHCTDAEMDEYHETFEGLEFELQEEVWNIFRDTTDSPINVCRNKECDGESLFEIEWEPYDEAHDGCMITTKCPDCLDEYKAIYDIERAKTFDDTLGDSSDVFLRSLRSTEETNMEGWAKLAIDAINNDRVLPMDF